MSKLFSNGPAHPEDKTSQVPSSHTIYAVLGFLQEYAGRYVSQDDLVEQFFADETEKAQIFEQYLLRLIEEQTLPLDFHSVVSQGHTYFHSQSLAQLINSYYLKHNLTGKDENGHPAYTKGKGFIRKNAGYISAEIFPPNDLEAKISFLVGAYQRYGQKNRNMYQFANAHHKAKLVQQLLKDVGSPHVVFVYSPPDYVPCVYNVAFEPTESLIKRLNLELFE